MSFVTIILAAAAAVVSPATPEPAAAPAKPMTAQQQFDAASAAQLEGRCDDAIKGFEALEQRPAAMKNEKVLATIRVRKGACLAAVGRTEEASAVIAPALVVLSENSPVERGDIARARMALGKIAYLEFDYASAEREFAKAKSLLPENEQVDSLVWLAQATMFDPDPKSIAYAEEATRIAQSAAPVTKRNMADLQTLHARALLNHGRTAEAFAELKKALAAKGGLTLRVSIADVVTRSDLALAAMLNNDRDAARQYLAYTGAGRFEKSPFATAAEMAPPACGGPGNLQSDDLAVVEFSVKDDGSIGYAAPIYVSRNGPGAAEFARAVYGWSWRPADVKNIPALFRFATRVELRCSTADERPDAALVLNAELESWLAERKASPLPETNSETSRVNLARAELARTAAEANSPGRIPALLALAASPLVSLEEQQKLLVQARDIATLAGAPVGARTLMEIRLVEYSGGRWADGGRKRKMLRALLARPEIAADLHAAATLRLLVAEAAYHSPAPPDAEEIVAAVANDTRLPAGDPIKTAAFARLASLQAKAGNIDAARQSYEKTGLSAQQCALVDAQPSMKKSGASSSDFPMEALRWGFEGWVRVEFDILPDGKTGGQRAIVAYPPLVFRDAAVGILRDTRYEQSYRPAGTLGCGGARQNINFRIPH